MADTPLPGQTPPWADTPPQTNTPLDRHPWAEIPRQTPPPGQTPPCPVHAGIHTPSLPSTLGYTPAATAADGTHPAGMLSCLLDSDFRSTWHVYFPSNVFFIVCSVHGHSDLAALVKASPYFQGLLPLSVECWDMDGDHTTLPVVFEDIYCEASIAKHRKLLLLVTMILSIYEHSKRQSWMN